MLKLSCAAERGVEAVHLLIMAHACREVIGMYRSKNC